MRSRPRDINKWEGEHIIFDSDGKITEVKRFENEEIIDNNNSNQEDNLDEEIIEEENQFKI